MSIEQYLGAGEPGPRPPPARAAGRVGRLRARAGRPLRSRCTSSRCATRPAPSAARSGSRVDVTEARAPTGRCASRRPGSRQVIDLVPHFIFAKDAEGRFLLANRAVAEAYGTTVDGLIGRTDADFARSEEEVRHFREDDLEVIRSGAARRSSSRSRSPTRGAACGTCRPRRSRSRSRAPAGPAVLGVSIDITERKAAEEALRRAAKEESLSRSRRRRRPRLQQPARRDPRPRLAGPEAAPGGRAPARRHVEKAAGAVERAADLTRQMLAYSGRGHFVVRPTDVNALVRENLPLLEVALPKSVRLEARLDPEPAAGGRRRRPDPAGADEPGHQRRRGDRRAGRDRHRGHRRARGGRVRRRRCGGRAGSRSRRAATCSSRCATTGRAWTRTPSTASSSRSSRRSSRAAASASPRCSASCAATGARLSVESAPGRGTVFRILFAPSARRPAAAARRDAGPPARAVTLLLDRRRGGGARHGRRGPRERGRRGAARRGRRRAASRSSASSGSGSTSCCSTSRCPG